MPLVNPQPRACPQCLRRADLLAALAPYLEKELTESSSSAGELLSLPNEGLAEALAPGSGEQILGEIELRGERELEASLRGADCWASCRHDDSYPQSLVGSAEAPWALIGRGESSALNQLVDQREVVAIVGARRATSYGREVARQLGRDLAASGLTVISGMAFGVDACAHRGALESGGTVAVLGCGPDVAYPASHRALWRRIQQRGLILSVMPPGTGAWRWAFSARNRIIAGLASLTIVVEAAPRSGSVGARLARSLGRQVGAVPGPVNSSSSAGTNELIASGASVIRGAQDALDLIYGDGVREVGSGAQPDPLELRGLAFAAIGEDRIPCEVLKELVSIYGREVSC